MLNWLLLHQQHFNGRFIRSVKDEWRKKNCIFIFGLYFASKRRKHGILSLKWVGNWVVHFNLKEEKKSLVFFFFSWHFSFKHTYLSTNNLTRLTFGFPLLRTVSNMVSSFIYQKQSIKMLNEMEMNDEMIFTIEMKENVIKKYIVLCALCIWAIYWKGQCVQFSLEYMNEIKEAKKTKNKNLVKMQQYISNEFKVPVASFLYKM